MESFQCSAFMLDVCIRSCPVAVACALVWQSKVGDVDVRVVYRELSRIAGDLVTSLGREDLLASVFVRD